MNRYTAIALTLLLPVASASAAVPSAIVPCGHLCVSVASAKGDMRVALVQSWMTIGKLDVALPNASDGWLIPAQATTTNEPKPAPDWRPTREIVLQLQRSLTTLGYDPGPIDGDMGPSTARAIRAYQKEREIEETGEFTQALMQRLEDEIEGQGGANGEEEAEELPPDIATETEVEITDDPSSYELGDLEDLNSFD